jgi:hypothetical protein
MYHIYREEQCQPEEKEKEREDDFEEQEGNKLFYSSTRKKLEKD